MTRIFVELPPFRKYLDALLDGQTVLRELQTTLLENPEAGDLITATGGLRKIRHGGKSKGKRGGYRVIYLYVPTVEKIYLIVLYAKNEADDLSPEEKRELKKLVEILKSEAK